MENNSKIELSQTNLTAKVDCSTESDTVLKCAWTIITVPAHAGEELEVLEGLKKAVEDEVVGKVLEEPIKMMILVERSKVGRYYVNLLINREINKINDKANIEKICTLSHLESAIKYMNLDA